MKISKVLGLKTLIAAALVASFSLTGCGSSRDNFVVTGNNPVPTPTPTVSPTPTPTPTPPAALLVSANNGSANLTSYTVNPTTGAIAATGSALAAGAAPAEVLLVPSASASIIDVYYTDQNDSIIRGGELNTTTGTLTPDAPNTFPTSVTGAFDIVADTSGRFVYVVGNTQVDGFSRNNSNGVLTRLANFPISPPGMTGGFRAVVSANNAFLYVGDGFSDTVYGYTINSASGALTAIAGNPFATGLFFTDALALTNDSGFLYATDDSGQVAGFAVTPGTGALTALGGFPINVNGGANGNACGVIVNGSKLYVSDSTLNSTDGFQIAANGSLVRLAGFPILGGGCGPVLVSNTPGALAPLIFAGFNSSQLLSFTQSASGSLTPAPGSPFAPGAINPASLGIFVR